MGFIGDTFSCKGMGLAEVGVKGKSIRSFVLRTCIIWQEGGEEVTYRLMGKRCPASSGGQDYPNIGMWGVC